MAIVQDTTERKQAEERLREYERVVEGLEEMIVVVDRDYRYVIANRSFLNYRGMKKERVIGRRVDEVVYKDVFDSLIKEKMEECFRGEVVAYEMKYTYPTLGERELFATYFPIEGPNGVRTESQRSCRILRRASGRAGAEGVRREIFEGVSAKPHGNRDNNHQGAALHRGQRNVRTHDRLGPCGGRRTHAARH